MTTVHLTHGFNVRDGGAASTDKLRPYFEAAGYAVDEDDYGWVGLLRLRSTNKRVAARLAAHVKPGDIGCGHSNGGLIVVMAADLGAPFAGLILIHPALESDRVFAPQVSWITVYHSELDGVVDVAEGLDWLPWNWRKEHPWGDMGSRGYTGDDPRCRNINDKKDHSGIFRHLKVWGPRIVENALAGSSGVDSSPAT